MNGLKSDHGVGALWIILSCYETKLPYMIIKKRQAFPSNDNIRHLRCCSIWLSKTTLEGNGTIQC
jgi:hypothetical protein